MEHYAQHNNKKAESTAAEISFCRTTPDYRDLIFEERNQITPCSIMALATFMKPAILAPFM